jgi:hypothetical protein
MLRDISVVPARVVLARAMNIRIDVVGKQVRLAAYECRHMQIKIKKWTGFTRFTGLDQIETPTSLVVV